MLRFNSKSPDETFEFAKNIAARLVSGDVLAFRGGLGAGKTAFTRGLAAGLGIDPDMVSSPTFALVNVYQNETGGKLYHFDMYRVMGFDALESTGFFDFLDDSGILAVEWSENIEPELPENTITVAITVVSENERLIEIEGGGRF